MAPTPARRGEARRDVDDLVGRAPRASAAERRIAGRRDRHRGEQQGQQREQSAPGGPGALARRANVHRQ